MTSHTPRLLQAHVFMQLRPRILGGTLQIKFLSSYVFSVMLTQQANSENCGSPLSGSNCLRCNHYGLVPIIALSVKWEVFCLLPAFAKARDINCDLDRDL